MQTIRVQTTQNVFIHYPIGSIGDRILAYLIDKLIMIVYSAAIVSIMLMMEIEVWWLWLLLLGFPWLFYSLLFEIFMNGQTPGKVAMKIKVVRLDGTPATVGDFLLRWIFSFIDFILYGAVAVVVISAGGKGQRLGDVVAGTSVVKLIEQAEITASQVFMTAEETYSPTFAQVTQLTPRDIELIQRALEMNRDQGNVQPVMIVAEKIKSMLGIQTDLPPVAFLSTLVKDFNHLSSR